MFRIVVGIACLLFTLSTNLAFAERLYLFSGQTSPYGDIRYPATLYAYSKDRDSLIQLRQVIDRNDGSERIYYSEESRQIIIRTWGEEIDLESTFVNFKVLSFDAPQTNKEIKVRYNSNMSILSSVLLESSDGKDIIAVEIADLDSENDIDSNYVGFDLIKSEQVVLDSNAYERFRVTGAVGGGVYAGDFVTDLLVDANKELFFRVNGRDVALALPPLTEGVVSPSEINVVYVNNDRNLVFAPLGQRQPSETTYGKTKFYILNKVNANWNTVDIPGSQSTGRCFGTWFVGYVADESSKGLSPGYNYRNRIDTNLGRSADNLFKDEQERNTGNIFLYNMETGDLYIYDTGEGDSEVLLVNDDDVYYRSYNKIYKASIGDKKLGNHLLLVQGEEVPNIHWAFMGPDQPTESTQAQ